MTGPREGEGSPRAAPARGGVWPASAAPHGYDRNEFSPGESRRDFPPRDARRRPRGPDEERRLLKEAEAAFEGPDRRHDASSAAGPWDGEGEDATPAAPPTRLYRE